MGQNSPQWCERPIKSHRKLQVAAAARGSTSSVHIYTVCVSNNGAVWHRKSHHWANFSRKDKPSWKTLFWLTQCFLFKEEVGVCWQRHRAHTLPASECAADAAGSFQAEASDHQKQINVSNKKATASCVSVSHAHSHVCLLLVPHCAALLTTNALKCASLSITTVWVKIIQSTHETNKNTETCLSVKTFSLFFGSLWSNCFTSCRSAGMIFEF